MSRFFHDEKVPEKLAGKQRVEMLKALEGDALLTSPISSVLRLPHASFAAVPMRTLQQQKPADSALCVLLSYVAYADCVVHDNYEAIRD